MVPSTAHPLHTSSSHVEAPSFYSPTETSSSSSDIEGILSLSFHSLLYDIVPQIVS